MSTPSVLTSPRLSFSRMTKPHFGPGSAAVLQRLPSVASEPSAARTKCPAYVAGSLNTVVSDSAPIEFRRRIHQKSMLASKLRVGCSTKPTVALLDFSGVRLGLPPVSAMNCTAQLSDGETPAIGLPPGQRTGSFQLFAVFVNVWAECSSYSDGARKPVVADPRTSHVGLGWKRAEIFGF